MKESKHKDLGPFPVVTQQMAALAVSKICNGNATPFLNKLRTIPGIRPGSNCDSRIHTPARLLLPRGKVADVLFGKHPELHHAFNHTVNWNGTVQPLDELAIQSVPPNKVV